MPRAKKTAAAAPEPSADLAPVEESVERPYKEAKANPKDIAAVEDRQPDQIADYHKTHPTLPVEG